jgi:hypothetical protein
MTQPPRTPGTATAEAVAEGVRTAQQLGLSLGDAWVAASAEAAARMFNGSAVKTMAALMAAAHPYAIDYIQQAPVLVLAVADGQANPRRRHLILTQWKQIMDRRDKLKKVMRYWALPQPLRHLKARPLTFARWRTVQILAREIDPSTLAQIIPKTHQGEWFRCVENWIDTFHRRLRRPAICAIPHLAWIGRVAMDPALRLNPGRAADMADFVFANMATFDPRVTWDQAQAGERAWHEKMAGKKAASNLWVAPDPLPEIWTHGEFEFVTLCTEAALIEEGAKMHHCVGSYWSSLNSDLCRIISLRLKGKRLATIELARHVEIIDGMDHAARQPTRQYLGSWRVRQTRGPCNRAINAPTWYAVDAWKASLRALGLKITN